MERREFLKSASTLTVATQLPWFVASGCASRMRSDRVADHASGILVNDAHAAMNPTWVRTIEKPKTLLDLQQHIKDAASQNLSVSIAGGRHRYHQWRAS